MAGRGMRQFIRRSSSAPADLATWLGERVYVWGRDERDEGLGVLIGVDETERSFTLRDDDGQTYEGWVDQLAGVMRVSAETRLRCQTRQA